MQQIFECGFPGFRYFVHRHSQELFVVERICGSPRRVDIRKRFESEEQAVRWCVERRIDDQRLARLAHKPKKRGA